MVTLDFMRDKYLIKAIEAVGGPTKLADEIQRLGGGAITSQAISRWRQVPPMRVLIVERATGISRHLLRPDIYPK